MAGLNYDSKSSASIFISVMDVDEDPEFQSSAPQSVSVPEDHPVGELLFTAEARDPEGKDIRYRMSSEY